MCAKRSSNGSTSAKVRSKASRFFSKLRRRAGLRSPRVGQDAPRAPLLQTRRERAAKARLGRGPIGHSELDYEMN